MANNHAQGTFEPQIPSNLFTKNDLDLLKALSISMDNYSTAPTSCPPKYKSTWDHDLHGENVNFPLEDWLSAAAHKRTTLEYQDWVTRNIESLLQETSLDGVDAIEIAGCAESDGIVEVIEEVNATFFSAYTHRPGKGVECVCDFNTKAQAVEFARALASRIDIPVYGNQCSIEEA